MDGSLGHTMNLKDLDVESGPWIKKKWRRVMFLEHVIDLEQLAIKKSPPYNASKTERCAALAVEVLFL